MKKTLWIFAVITLLMGMSCSSKKSKAVKLSTDTDSVAYILGMNIAMNLQKMDSTISYHAVCKGIQDFFEEEEKLTLEEARTYFLSYVNYALPEKARAYEEQFLEDISKANRKFARTKSGVTYAVDEIGDQDLVPTSERDTVTIRYVLRTADEREVFSSYTRNDTTHIALGDVPAGVRESLKLIGKGGKIKTWIPSKDAYGAEGNEALGIGANQVLYYEIELLDVKKYIYRFR